MNLKQLRCTVCGATIDAKNIDFTKRTARCNACYETFVIEQAENFAKVEVDKTKDIQNYRENLASAVEKEDAMGMIRLAGQILDILPDDYDATYFYAYAYSKRGDSRYLYDFLGDMDNEYTEESAMRIADHLAKHSDLRDEKKVIKYLKSLHYEPETYVALYKETFADRIKKEELYDDITRDVFICHRSTNAEVANRILRALEEDGNTCWISSRNLRPNDNENYWTNIQKAIKSCRVFLVVSTRDAMISGDIKKEMVYAKELNKRRIEIKLDESEHNAFFKDFFDGCKWIKGENYGEIKARVADLVAKAISGKEEVVIRKVDKIKFTPIKEAKPQEKVVIDELHEHKFEKAEVVPPTCTEPGYTVYRCVCGEIKKQDFMPKRTEHDFQPSERKEPTCTEDGYIKYECRYCDATKKDALPAIGHNFKLSEEKPSTCIEEGYRIYTCQNCGEKKVEKLPLIPHAFGAWVKTKNPTCTEDGEETKQCTFCGYKESRPIAPSGHKFGKWVIKTEPTCTEEGTKVRQCLICGSAEEEKVAPTGHDFGEWQSSLTDPEKEERVCKKCGAIETRLRREVEEELKNAEKRQEEEKTARKNKKNRTVALGSFIVSLASLLCAIILWGVFYKRGYCAHPVTVVLTFFLSFALILVSLILTKKMEKSGYYHFIIDIPILMVCAIIIGILFFSNGIHSATSQKAYYQDGVFYAKIEDGYEVATTKNKKKLTILSNIKGEKVVSVHENAFRGDTKLTAITIPDNVTSIGNYAFYGCSNVKSITMPSSIIEMGEDIFYGCSSVEELTLPFLDDCLARYFNKESSYYSFRNLIPSSLNKVTVLKGSIPGSAFKGCDNVTSVTMCEGVTSIDQYAFMNCSKLTTVYLADTVTSIGSKAFSGCTSLKDVYFGGNKSRQPIIYSDNTYLASATWHYQYLCNVTGGEHIALSPVQENEIMATCTQKGQYDNVVYCKDCGKELSRETEETYSLGHKPAEAVQENIISVTCTTAGTYDSVVYCERCGEEISRETITKSSPLGHKPAEAVQENITVTCTEIGTYDSVVYCERCGEEISRETIEIDALGHNYEEQKTYATEYEEGYTIKTCLRCQEVIYEYISPVKAEGLVYTLSENDEYSVTGYTGTGTDVIIPSKHQGVNVTSIGYAAFSGCSDMEKLTIPNGVTKIDNYAFEDCSRLRTISIPESLNDIGKDTFSGCDSLQYTEYGNGCYLGNIDNPYVVLIKVKNIDITTFVTHDSIKVIFYYAFKDCRSLTDITIGSGVTSIGEHAFDDCVIKTATIPAMAGPYIKNNPLTTVMIVAGDTIPASAFFGCSSLTSATMGNSVVTIGTNAFSGCSTLTSVDIPDSVTNIDANAFSGCSSLVSIVFPNSIANIGDGAFSGCSTLTSVDIPDSVTNIGANAFSGCSSLVSIVFPNSIANIGDGAFVDCCNLTSIKIPESVISIGSGSFSGCSALEDMTIPFIGSRSGNTGRGALLGYIFGQNSYTGGIKTTQQYGSNTNYYTVVYYIPYSLKHIKITSETSIHYGAFMNCSYLLNIIINDGITNIGDCAFYNCSSLESIVVPNSVTEIGIYAFSGCKNLTSITISNRVENIGCGVFSGCSSLVNLTMPFGYRVTGISSGDKGVYYAFGPLFGHDPYIGSVNITQYHNFDSSVHWSYSIPASLRNITVSGGNISYGAFYNCSMITSIILSDNITGTGDFAFYGCTSLTAITITDSIMSIGESAFSSCSGLRDIYFSGTKSQWDVIPKKSGWDDNTSDFVIHCTNGDIAKQ